MYFLIPWFATVYYCRVLGFSIESYCSNSNFLNVHAVKMNKTLDSAQIKQIEKVDIEILTFVFLFGNKFDEL